MQEKCLLVTTSCPDNETASTLARALVEAKLAACIQISAPVTSLYTWEGEVCQETEVSLQIKCLARHYDKLEQTLLSLHPYQVPELIATEIHTGSAAYLAWIKETSLS
ncbi:divalent-cation tolerance protein CutA [Shewanella insulae]|uniref:Divalent cation tolerance protein CutA n=1 Tax=Shewanella insulae TaxID=2681496 RepID=A0A6L7HTV8_9GAMM|nr:divalent-cation tolerance protein CutA [Shewanella insulae]MCG9712504.1 divalent-cation tolerance protein CutA [Shewanella insulae]MCG9738357.1 divalent-cation tolerance protein CutA [Shewanella insulae]MCG9754219.1 divalent-cation tolerance protein CutA [Shewanella insulae]MXR67737.1 divalent cation tolerance protein CutA [Shewanella insulae]